LSSGLEVFQVGAELRSEFGLVRSSPITALLLYWGSSRIWISLSSSDMSYGSSLSSWGRSNWSLDWLGSDTLGCVLIANLLVDLGNGSLLSTDSRLVLSSLIG